MPEFESFEDDVAAFEQGVGGAKVVLAEFTSEMRSMQSTVSDTKEQVSTLSTSLSKNFRSGLEGVLFGGKNVSDAFKGMAQSTLGSAYRAAVNPVMKQTSSLLSGGIAGAVQNFLPFANGAGFSGGRPLSTARVAPFASGGIVDRATTFPMRGGTGLMGEAGPEAIMPLSRGADGRLGVRAGGGAAPVQVVMNVTTSDAESFRRSESQISARMGRALSRGARNR